MATTDKGQIGARRRFEERVKARRPDLDFNDEESLYSALDEDYGTFEDKLSRYEAHEREIADMFASDPRSAEFFLAMKRGDSLPATLIRTYGDEFREALDDPSKAEELAAAQKDFLKRAAREKEYEQQYQANLTQSLAELKRMQADENIDDATMDNAVAVLEDISKSFILGKITPESIHMVINAINHDADVASAGMEGEIRGRNTSIDEKLRKRTAKDMPADLGGRNGAARRSREASIFDLANQA